MAKRGSSAAAAVLGICIALAFAQMTLAQNLLPAFGPQWSNFGRGFVLDNSTPCCPTHHVHEE
jgi:hypothetical protein